MLVNLVIAVVLTVVFQAAKVPQGADETLPHQYNAEAAVPASLGVGIGATGAARDLP